MGKARSKKVVSECVVHIYAHFNNTIITISDRQGNALCQASPARCNYRGARKSTPHAAGEAAKLAINEAIQKYQVSKGDIEVRGAGMGRDSAIKAVAASITVLSIEDKTGIPHNGCRPKKKKRV